MRLIDRNWKAELDQCAAAATGPVTIVCPFVNGATLANLLASIGPQHLVRLLTRFSLRDDAAGVSDLAALQRVLDAGGAVRGVRGLHAKVYVFGDQAVVTSANLTARGLGANQEFGCVSDDAAFVATCTVYTDRLWDAAGPNLTAAQLHDWDAQVTAARVEGATVPLLDACPTTEPTSATSPTFLGRTGARPR